jgi:8-oxo-dGTP diphosphatase
MIIDKVAALVFKDRKVLFARTRGIVLAYTIGGKRKTGESDQQALDRECIEETGAVLKPESIKYLHTFVGPAHNKPEGTKVSLASYVGEFENEPIASQEVEELVYLSHSDGNKTTESGRMILDYLKKHDLID